MKKQRVILSVILFLVSMVCFFADHSIPPGWHEIKLVVWLIFSPGALLYIGPEFTWSGFLFSLAINFLWSLFLGWILSKFLKDEPKNDINHLN